MTPMLSVDIDVGACVDIDFNADIDFDDVFSELDNDRTERLLHLLVADQTFITTAIQPKIIQQNMYHEVKEGKVLVS